MTLSHVARRWPSWWAAPAGWEHARGDQPLGMGRGDVARIGRLGQIPIISGSEIRPSGRAAGMRAIGGGVARGDDRRHEVRHDDRPREMIAIRQYRPTSIAPSRRCRCQSSGRIRVSVRVMVALFFRPPP